MISFGRTARTELVGRQNRPRLYRLAQERPLPLVPEDLRFDVPERIDHRGDVLTPLDDEAVRRVAAELNEQGVESVAVVFLFSFLNPIHERRAGYVRCSLTVAQSVLRPHRHRPHRHRPQGSC